MEEPYWVRYHRELRERNTAAEAVRNPPPPKVTDIVPLLHWDRTIRWWPKYNWERYDTVTCGNDLSPADRGYKLREIRDLALIYDGGGEDEFLITSIEVTYRPSVCEECPQECCYFITHKCDTPDEEVVCEDGFKTIDDARQAAAQAFAAIVKRGA